MGLGVGWVVGGAVVGAVGWAVHPCCGTCSSSAALTKHLALMGCAVRPRALLVSTLSDVVFTSALLWWVPLTTVHQ